MRIIISSIFFLLTLLLAIFSFDIDRRNFSNQLTPSSIEILSKKDTVKPLTKADSVKIENFIKGFYQSLELSPEEIQRTYENGEPFRKSEYKTYLSTAESYSKSRVQILTGDYHPMFYIGLKEITGISLKDSLVTAETIVNYAISEYGSFVNEELLEMDYSNDSLKLKNWYDVKAIEFKPWQGWEGPVDKNPGDYLYKQFGSNFRHN